MPEVYGVKCEIPGGKIRKQARLKMNDNEQQREKGETRMIAVRKIQRINKSLVVVIPKAYARFIGVKKGSHVIMKRLNMKYKNGILIEKLTENLKSEETSNDDKDKE